MTARKVPLAAAVAVGALAAASAADVDFARGKWNRDDFVAVKSWRWNHVGAFDQLDDAIVNRCPDKSGEEIHKKHGNDVYAALVHKTRLGLGATAAATMSFDYRMAPIVVIARELGAAADGTPEFREHWEACLFDKGINLWHHTFEDGKQKWRLAASLRLPKDEYFKPNVKYTLAVRVFKDGYGAKCIEVSCGGHSFTHEDAALPDDFLAGIIGCEGRNFFYDFATRP
ncbi:MAG: hypothetical protein IJ829_00990 [Kiritimatiellae bacterium]|nr:hypothetical protein [Kiritimatiellia bacterium]